MEQTDDEKLISDDAELYSNDDFSNISEKQLVKGTIVAVNDKEVLVDIGFKSEGTISLSEFDIVPAIGDEIEIFLVVFEDRHGRLILSKERADFENKWLKLRTAFSDETEILGIITAARIPRITITAINSIKVKPDCDILFLMVLLPLFY